jgi:hypothetical protein
MAGLALTFLETCNISLDGLGYKGNKEQRRHGNR